MAKTKRKAVKQGGNASKKKRGDNSSDGGDDRCSLALKMSVNDELEATKKAALEAENEQFERENAEGSEAPAAVEDAEKPENEEAADPYLMADAEYIKKDTRWRNKQRILVFASRGVNKTFRHLCEDIKRLIPHHKAEPKFEKKDSLHEINEICELKSCNNVVYFECRKKEHLYMHIARVPEGPTLKFQVKNVHTASEVRLAGNCLLGSRPLLHFDKIFDKRSELALIKTMFTQVFGTPRNHPKSKPFHDHILGFYYLDHKIWLRHYQITPDTVTDMDDPERQQLTEIGPRFVLEPVRILNNSFSGQTLYLNGGYMTPRAMRVHARKMLQKRSYGEKQVTRENRKKKIEDGRMPEDPTEEAFV